MQSKLVPITNFHFSRIYSKTKFHISVSIISTDLQFLYFFFSWHRLQFSEDTTTKVDENKLRFGWRNYIGKITTSNSIFTTKKFHASGKFADIFTGSVNITGEKDLWFFEKAPKELKMLSAKSIFYK